MRRVYGEHSGENLGLLVLELLQDYGICGDRIGYFMLDNASSNDTAVDFILKELCPWMTPKQRRHRRLRCLGHIINPYMGILTNPDNSRSFCQNKIRATDFCHVKFCQILSCFVRIKNSSITSCSRLPRAQSQSHLDPLPPPPVDPSR